ncbi:hypothetical protein ACFU7Y_24855 [Kitasatospora sp. NPDC057542]|uniref:hypothetical protein n=1 Tax=Kitasatospora sp. NPDC057542 TaxID=3346162 RepID=UPI0036C290D0
MRFAKLLFVLTGAGDTGFANRCSRLELTACSHYVARMLQSVPAGVASLEDLEADGPGAELWWPIADLDSGPVPWWEPTGIKPDRR